MVLAVVMLLAMGTTAFAAEAKTGSITINNADNVTVENKTFNAYKVLDLKLSGNSYVYTVPEELKDFYANYFHIDKNVGDFSAQVVNKINALKDQKLFDFAQAALAAAKKANITPGTATAGEGAKSVTISNLPLGYYVVEDAGAEKPVSALIMDTTNPNVNVTIKADKPSIDKNIVDSEGQNPTDHNNVAIGDKINFKVTSKVPNMTGYEKYYFVVKDTMSKGLTFNEDAVVTVGDVTLTQGTNYTLTTTTNDAGETVIEIVFKDFIKQKPGDAIVITYSATLNENAVVGTDGNTNKVKLEYSNNPNVKDDGEPGNPDKPGPNAPTGETPEEVTYTYVTGIELTKVDEEGNRLQGAEFEITGTKLNNVLVKKDVFTESEDGTYYKLKDGTYTTVAPTDETNDQYESTTTKYTKETKNEVVTTSETVKAKAVVGDDGVIRFDGLAAGEYTITELKAPDGYNLLKDPIKVNISWEAPEGASTECKWSATAGESAAVVEDGIIKLEVVNKAGSELPSTGGIGTTIFYAVGASLMVFAAVVLITKKRMSFQK